MALTTAFDYSDIVTMAMAFTLKKSLDYFQAHQITSKLLSLTSTSHHVASVPSRTPKPTGEDGFFAETVQTARTIPHVAMLWRRDERIPPSMPRSPQEAGYAGAFPPPGKGEQLVQARERSEKIADEEIDVHALLAFGEPGVNGHPGTLHGGMTSMLMDETMAMAVELHLNKTPREQAALPNGKSPQRDLLFTAQLDVRFRAPVRTSDVAVLKAWVVAREGRKIFVCAKMLQEQGEQGVGAKEGTEVVCAEAYAVFILATAKL